MIALMSITAYNKAFTVGQKKIILNPCSRWLMKVTKRLDLTTFDHYRMGLNLGRPLFFFLVLAFMSANSIAQVTFDSKEELLEAANDFFNQGDYVKAKPLFSQLLSQDALDPNFNYRFGVCMLFTEDDVVKPLPFIEGGANSPGVNAEAFYYLGKAYHLNFRFDEAIEAFQKASGKSVSIAGVDISKEIQACRNGKLLYNPDLKFDPVMDKEAIESEFFRPYNFRKLKGKVIPTPPNFKTKYDQKNLTGGFVYTPTSTQVLFYASYGEEGTNGKDIYRVRRLPTGDWALPVKLPNQINTAQDEDHAFFDEISNTLYFSSNGHNSMGGLDIFSSKYDAKDDSWSSPVNLQYPYNSPFDDFLYISDPDNTVAFFCSRRSSDIGKVRVFQNSLVDQSIPELSIITGQYLEDSDSTATQMKAQLKGADGIVGEYRTDKTGGYVIVAPPMQGYELTVAPREKEAFQFELNLPKHYKFKALEQEAVFRTDASGGEVALTNYFNSKGKEDSLVTVQRKTSGELPDLVASIKASESELAEQNVLAAAEQGKEEARQEILAIERKVREQAVQDSLAAIAQAEKEKAEQLAAAEAQKKAEEERIAKENELAEAKKQEEEKARIEEEQRKQAELAQKQKTLDSLRVAKEEAEMLAAAELKKAEEEKARQAAEAAETAEIEEQQRLANLKKDEEARQEAQEAEIAAAAEQKRLDELRAAEEKAAQLALDQKREAEEKESKVRDSLALAAAKAEELAAAKLKEEEALAEKALAAAEKARLDSIDAEVERMKQLALEEAKRGGEFEGLDQEEKELVAAQKAAEAEHEETNADIALANETAKAESGSTSALEVEQAKAAAKGEAIVDGEVEQVKEYIKKEEKANQELDDLNRQVAERTAVLSGDTSLEIASDNRITELKQRIEVLEEEKSKRDVERQLELLDQRMETQKEIDQLTNAEKGQLEQLKEAEKEKEAALEIAQDKETDLLAQIREIESNQKDQPEEVAEEKQEVEAVAEEIPTEIEEPAVVETAEVVEVLESEKDELAEDSAAKPELESADLATEKPDAEEASEDVKEFQNEIIEEIVEAKADVETKEIALEEASEPVAAEAEQVELTESQDQPVLNEDVSDADMFLSALKELEGDLVKEPVVESEAEESAEMADAVVEETQPELEETASKEDNPAKVVEVETSNPEVPKSAEVDVAKEPQKEVVVSVEVDEKAIESAFTPEVEEPVNSVIKIEEVAAAVDTSNELEEEVKKEAEQVAEAIESPATETSSEPEIAIVEQSEEIEKLNEPVETATEELAVVETVEDEKLVDSSLDADRKAILDHQKMAAKKEAELKAKMDADKAALGISSSELQEESVDHKTTEAELNAAKELSESGKEEIVVKTESAETELPNLASANEPKTASDEFLEAIKLIEEGQNPEPAEVVEAAEVPEVEAVAEEEPVKENLTEEVTPEELVEAKNAVEDEVTETTSAEKTPEEVAPVAQEKEVVEPQKIIERPKEPKEVANVEELVGDFDPMASRVFKIKPALRDYSLRKFDPNTVEDRKTRRLLQRMSAEDRGRLAVMKNIHNASIDAKGSDKAIRAITEDQRNSEVLASRKRVAREAEAPVAEINWRDRGKRSDVSYRLSFDFRPNSISDRIREAMDPASEAAFSVPTVKLESGRFYTLSEARSAQLEYSWKGFSEPQIKAFYKGDPIELLTAIAKPVVE